MFINYYEVKSSSTDAFTRMVIRALLIDEYSEIREIGHFENLIHIVAHKNLNKWLFCITKMKKITEQDIDSILASAVKLHARIPVMISMSEYNESILLRQRALMNEGIPLQLWTIDFLIDRLNRYQNIIPNNFLPRPYQEQAINRIIEAYDSGKNKALVVLATGLGKTFVVADTSYILNSKSKKRILVMAHTNPLVYQLEKSFWKFMTVEDRSIIWNGFEAPKQWQLEQYEYVFACVNTVAEYIGKGNELPRFDVIIIDECHHAGSSLYECVFSHTYAGKDGGPFLIGITATPWRPDEKDIEDIFGDMVVCVDMLEGLKKKYLAPIDYRMFTDNIDWEALSELHDESFTPRQINKKFFIEEWDDSVVYEIQNVWKKQNNPRAIVFCGTIDHANILCNKLNALGFCNAAAIFSNSNKDYSIDKYEKNRILSEFDDGRINIICTVDLFNEGLDVPDVNIIVFQRVTHSRRIFIQQLGRGLRTSSTKEKVIVLDFVSDIRRFAAGLELKQGLAKSDGPTRISIDSKVSFYRVNGEDPSTEQFLTTWLKDIGSIEMSGENTSVLTMPPEFPDSKR